MTRNRIRQLIALVITTLALACSPAVYGQTEEAGQISTQIKSTQSKIGDLEKEIAKYERELVSTEKQKNDLSKALKTLDISKRKLEAETSLTNTKIDNAVLAIKSLGADIQLHNQDIDQRLAGLGQSMRSLYATLDESPIEIVLSETTLANSVDKAYDLLRFQSELKQNLDALQEAKERLVSNKTDLETEKQKLDQLKSRLIDQKKLVIQSQSDKEYLLSKTKNKEAEYKELLEKKIKEKEEFERELRSYEAKLRSIDLSNVPSPSSGVLGWPLDNVFITQYFGNTEFAKKNAQIYNGKGHNAIDLRASIGTAIKSAAEGRVEATGNTDLGCPGGSYGKWILITHNNGLSTLYAHLSLVKVNKSDNVARGDLIGYSGSTGYSTGPHLHFAVYASAGVKVSELIKSDGTKSKCGEMPVSPLNGYLNPLLYL